MHLLGRGLTYSVEFLLRGLSAWCFLLCAHDDDNDYGQAPTQNNLVAAVVTRITILNCNVRHIAVIKQPSTNPVINRLSRQLALKVSCTILLRATYHLAWERGVPAWSACSANCAYYMPLPLANHSIIWLHGIHFQVKYRGFPNIPYSLATALLKLAAKCCAALQHSFAVLNKFAGQHHRKTVQLPDADNNYALLSIFRLQHTARAMLCEGFIWNVVDCSACVGHEIRKMFKLCNTV